VAPATYVHVFVRMIFETVTAGAKKIAFFWGMIPLTWKWWVQHILMKGCHICVTLAYTFQVITGRRWNFVTTGDLCDGSSASIWLVDAGIAHSKQLTHLWLWYSSFHQHLSGLYHICFHCCEW